MILGKLCFETMRLETITKIIQPITIRGPLTFDIEGIAYDSRHVRPNYLFVAVRGQQADGARFIEDALKRGAVAVVSEEDNWPRRDIAHIHVADARQAMAEISCAFYNNPSEKIDLIGITGTNGKTTTSFMIRDILRAANKMPGLMGTVRYEIGPRVIPATRTTPEAPDVQFMLDQMVRSGCRSAVMEVSSHALDQKRIWGTDFDIGVFTNLTRDHLDYHKNMPRYFLAKSLLFRGLGQLEKKASAVINIDDPWGMELSNIHGLSAQLITYGTHVGAMVRAEDIDASATNTKFHLKSPWGDADIQLNSLGRYNVSNALAAIASCGVLGIKPDVMAKALSRIEQVPGRLEKIANDRGIHVFVDYAHTDDALLNVLQTLRDLKPKRLITVFGCGGNRDKSKRPLMGSIAARHADFTIVTNDNPRKENPEEIIAEIVAGMGDATNFESVTDRETAIGKALGMARAGDIVLIAGKGHENYQEFAHTVIPFDDREIARRFLAKNNF